MCFGKHPFIEVDEELRLLIPRPTKEEVAQLEANIKADGEIKEPVTVWGNVLVDGYTRLDIARRLDMPFHLKRREFRDNDEAKAWMLRNQLGRRNLSPDQMSLIRAELYRVTKEERGDCRKNFGEGERSSEIVAKQTGVTSRTVENDAKYAETVKKLTPEVRDAVVNHDVKATRKAVKELAEKPPEEQKAVVAKVKAGEAKTVQEAIKKPPKPEPEADHWLDPLQAPYEEAVSLIQKTKRIVKAIAELEKDGAHLAHLGTFRHIEANLKEAETHIKANKPAAGCPKCGDEETRGKGCKSCYGCGFISQVVHKGLTAKVG